MGVPGVRGGVPGVREGWGRGDRGGPGVMGGSPRLLGVLGVPGLLEVVQGPGGVPVGGGPSDVGGSQERWEGGSWRCQGGHPEGGDDQDSQAWRWMLWL